MQWLKRRVMGSLVAALSWSVDAQEIVVEARSLVARAPSGWAFVEPHLAASPTNPQQLVGISILTPAAGSPMEKGPRMGCRSARTTDGGVTWTQADLAVTWCYDPWVSYTATGEVVAAVSARHPTVERGEREALLVFRSPDGGRQWLDPPSAVRRSPDHPTIAMDTSRSGWRGTMYVFSGQTLEVSRSNDEGRSFGTPVRIVPNNLVNLAETPVVLSDGTLVLSFVDGGWWRDNAGAMGFFRQRRAWTVSSRDGGVTFGPPAFVTDVCGQPPHFQQSFLATGRSPTSGERLYFACRRAGGGPIVVAHSSTGGARWSEPVPVSSDVADSTQSRVAVLAVSPEGTLGVAWIIGRPRVPCHEVWFTASTTGGSNFLPPIRVSAPACASAAWATSGDYFGLSASPTGQFHLLWGEPDGESGVLRHAILRVRRPE